MDCNEIKVLSFVGELKSSGTNDIDYSRTIGGDLIPEARQLLLLATRNRERLVESLSIEGNPVDPRNAIAAVESYLPSVWKIQESLEYSSSARIELNQKLEFTWTSVLNTKNKTWTNDVFVYEVCMILVIRALAHYAYAKNLTIQASTVDADQAKTYIVDASKQLRIGAGLLQFVAKQMLPRWLGKPEDSPPEVSIPLISCLSQLFLCTAQRLTVINAKLKQTSHRIIAQLLLGLSTKYDSLYESLQDVSKKTRANLVQFIQDEPAQFGLIAKALAYKALALDCVEKSDSSDTPDVLYGKAEAFIAASYGMIKGVTLATSTNQIKSALSQEVTEIGEKFAQIKSDNEKVYYGKVIALDALELPKEQFLAKPVEFKMPSITVVSFAAVEKTAPPPPMTASAPPYTPRYIDTAPTTIPVAVPAYPIPLCPSGVDPSCKYSDIRSV